MKQHISVLNPTTHAEDVLGDTTGLTGITKNSSSENSFPKESYSDKEYTKQVVQGMSHVAVNRSNDVASEEDVNANASQSLVQAAPDTFSSQDIPPSIEGEQSISGDMPSVESDDDTLSAAQDVGMQLEEDEEHPQELDIARDIDRAEQSLH